MNAFIEVPLLVILALLAVPVVVLFVQVLAARLPAGRRPDPGDRRPRVAILVPAHNEAGGIPMTLASLRPQLQAGDRLLVVADNCSDATAQVARVGGAEVVERSDLQRRGKGYALDAGLRHLAARPPDIVLFVDADCRVSAGSVDRLARLCASTGRPVQALDLMKAPPPASPSMAIAEFAWLVKNCVRPLGLMRLGLPCQLAGTGMAVDWEAICSVRLASNHLVEDMQMGIDLARIGRPPLFCPEALVTSEFPRNPEGARTQRTRWEHGHLAMIVGTVPRMLLEGLLGRGKGLLAMALDICVPPLALLGMAVFGCAVLAGAYALATSNATPLWLAASIVILYGSAVLFAWQGHGRRVLSFRNLLLAFPYAARKLPLYGRFVVRRQVEWVRSKRDGE